MYNMGFFKSDPVKKAEKEAKKQEAKDTRQAYKDAGRQKMPIFIDHIGGHPELTANTSICVAQGLDKYTLRLNDNLVTVKGLEWDEKGQRSAGKAVAGAIVGGVLTGGIGLLAGAAIGGKKNDNSVAILTCTDGVIEYTVYFRADSEKYQKLASLL
jgi:hypothetical protein